VDRRIGSSHLVVASTENEFRLGVGIQNPLDDLTLRWYGDEDQITPLSTPYLVDRGGSDLQILFTDEHCPIISKLRFRVWGYDGTLREKHKWEAVAEGWGSENGTGKQVLVRTTHPRSDVFATNCFQAGLDTAYTGRDPTPDPRPGSAR